MGVLYELNLRSRTPHPPPMSLPGTWISAFITAVKEQGLKGVKIQATTVREYETGYAAHILGRVGAIYAEEWQNYKNEGYSMDDTVGKDGDREGF